DGTDLSPLLTRSETRQKFRRTTPLFWVSPTSQPIAVVRDDRYALVGYRKSEYPRDAKRIAQVMAGMEKILDEELKLGRKLTQGERWHHCWNYECKRDDWRKLRGEFVTLNMFQESWCPLIKAGSGGFGRFELYDLKRDPNQSQNVAVRFPVVFERLKKQAIDFHTELMEEAVDWSDPKHVAAVERGRSTIEEATRIHRLESTNRSIYDAFTYVNRIPEKPNSDETADDFSARVFSRLANQEGRILLKAPPGMSPQAYVGYKTFLQYEGTANVGNCAACHTPQEFTDRKTHVVKHGAAPTKTPSLRNLATGNVDLRKALKEKLTAAKQKQAGNGDDVSDAYSNIKLTDQDVEHLIEFLKLLDDGSDNRFRKLILEAKLMDVSVVDEATSPRADCE
ncbi:hypothetical protein OAH18_02810, partial [bacterium]|nr:hypothetical protein [bacterium]